MKYLSFLFALVLGLPSCVCTTSDALMASSMFAAKADETEPISFYRKGERYFLSMKVAHECKVKEVTLGGVLMTLGGPELSVPVNVDREKESKRYYFLLSPEAVESLFGKQVEYPEGDIAGCIPEEEWDATAAQQVPCAVKEANFVFLLNDSYGYYHADVSQFTLQGPRYKPWDYWVKAPLAAVLLLGVDVPCTVAGNAALIAGELLVLPAYFVMGQSAEPTYSRPVEPIAPAED